MKQLQFEAELILLPLSAVYVKCQTPHLPPPLPLPNTTVANRNEHTIHSHARFPSGTDVVFDWAECGFRLDSSPVLISRSSFDLDPQFPIRTLSLLCTPVAATVPVQGTRPDGCCYSLPTAAAAPDEWQRKQDDNASCYKWLDSAAITSLEGALPV